ncbi:MAG: ArnT family glycosyltransferase [Halobaculum sp.]
MWTQRVREEWEGYLLVGLGLVRYAGVLAGGVTHDEVFYAQAGLSMFSGYMYGNPTHMHAPLVKYLIGAGQVLWGVSAVSIRAPIAAVGVLSVYVTYRVGRAVFDRWVGVVGGLLLVSLPAYGYYATMAMLDVPLAVLVTGAFGTVVWWGRTQNRWGPTALGAVTVLMGATKVQGALYVVGAVVAAAVLWTAAADRRSVAVHYAAGVTATFAFVYLPFAFSPSPAYYSGANPPAVVRTLFAVPWLGNVGYAFAAALVHNLSHLGSGHEVTVLGTTYVDPPAWVFGYWLATRGGVPFLIGAVGALGALSGRWSDRPVRLAVGTLVVGPMVIHSLLTVKLPRYLVPLYPLLAVLAGWILVTTARGAVRRIGSPNPSRLSLAVGLLLVAAAVAPPAFAGTGVETDVRTDTGAASVLETTLNSTDGSLTIVTSNPLVFRWYLGEHRVGNFSKQVHDPKTFRVGQRRVVLVGTQGDRSEVRPSDSCVLVVGSQFVDANEGSETVRRTIREGDVIAAANKYRAYAGC